jgi:FkbM family methyltransferase
LGGNIGTTTLLMSEVLSDKCKIYSFEPIYSDILLKNVIDNNLSDKVEVYPFGIGNSENLVKTRKVDFSSSQIHGAFSIMQNLEDSENSFDIKIFPLDDFNFENVSLIKIDVENMEIEVLEGAYKLIEKCKPTILIESHQIDFLHLFTFQTPTLFFVL